MAGSLPESIPSLKLRTSLWLLQMVPVNRPVPHRKTGEAHAPAASQHQLLVLQELTLNSDSAPFMWLFGQSFERSGVPLRVASRCMGARDAQIKAADAYITSYVNKACARDITPCQQVFG